MIAAVTLALLAAAAPEPACTPPGAAACEPATPASPEVREKVRAYLGAIDRPITPETWLALGPGAETVLAEVAASDDFPSRRSLALEGLAAFGGPRAEALHRRLAVAGAAPAAVRRAAVRGLARVLPSDRLPEVLGPLLERDPDDTIRRTAAEALATRAPGLACGAVRAQARREGIRGDALYARALGACAR
jgi:hypothetical protein